MKVVKVVFNYYPPHSTLDYPDGHEEVEIGKDNCISIDERLPQGEGDRLYYTAHYANGTMKRIFNPNTVTIHPSTSATV